MRRAAFGIGACLFSVASAAAAHPGHGLAGGSESWLHYATDPLHVAPFVLAALALASWRRARAHARKR